MTKDDSESFCFVDSNIWIYAFIKQQDMMKSEIAHTLIRNHKIAVSIQVINEVCFNLLKKTAISENDIQKLVKTFFINYRIVVLDELVLLTSSQLRENYRFSFWDSIIVASALNDGIKTLYSEDMQHGLLVNQCLSIVNPFLG